VITLEIQQTDGSIRLFLKGRCVLEHSPRRPLMEIGYGTPTITMSHGNFDIRSGLTRRIPLTICRVETTDGTSAVLTCPVPGGGPTVTMKVSAPADDSHGPTALAASISVTDNHGDEAPDRVFLRLPAARNEGIYGGGEQYSRFNMRGSRLPLWTGEQGVGRAHNLTTWLANRHSDAGGSWHSTYFPQPTFVSDSGRYIHLESSGYMLCDFASPESDTFEVWQNAFSFRLGVADDVAAAVIALGDILGRQPRLPDWADTGMWLGLQGGSGVIREKTRKARDAGIPLAGLWVQDWEGKRVTAFGSQLFWNWKYSKEMYPDLPDLIEELKDDGIRFLGYINPFLAVEGDLYQEARDKNYCVKNSAGEDYLITVTTFPAALVDMSNPEAFEWIKGVIKEHMLGIGLSGWMADFGEYLPTDAVLHSADAGEFHNRYPAEWARANYEAMVEAGRLEDTAIFMRAGFTGSSRYTHSVWAGDQMVDWSRHDGLPSVIPAALSAGIAGIGVHHSDLGGYTTLFHHKRSKELFMRWAEESAFTPIMRSHEGNRPASNWQWDSDDETMNHLAAMVRVFVKLRPYRRAVLEEYYNGGLPVQRPVQFHYPEWSRKTLKERQYRYLFGRDLFVAPVLKKGVRTARITLPRDTWIHLWTGREFTGDGKRACTVAAPPGQPPVFYRAESPWNELFRSFGIR
jgi:sulfoquinovosidase